jgi:glycosyltransferase involved in cell wall biosynthesis
MLLDREHAISNPAADWHEVPSPGDLVTRYRTVGRRVVLYAGSFEPYQGLELLVDAAPIVLRAQPDTVFLCLGGCETQIAELRRQAYGNGVEEHFLFPGVVPEEAIPAHFGFADILLSLRLSGINVPLKIYAYLRSGVPILGTNVSAHTQVLNSEVALLVDPQPNAIAAGILLLLKNGDLGRQLTRNALKLAQEKFSIDAYYAKVAQVYAFLEARRAPLAG